VSLNQQAIRQLLVLLTILAVLYEFYYD